MEVIVHARRHGLVVLIGDVFAYHLRIQEAITANAECHASQRETKFDRALRRARKLRLRLGGDPADDEYPDKPPRMRWTTNKLVAAEGTFGAHYERARAAWDKAAR
jgi:hypothetical protein